MNVFRFAVFPTLASASSEYRLNGKVDPFTLTPTYYLSYYVDNEFVFGAKGQDGFYCCSAHDKDTIRKDIARSTELCKDESSWASMAEKGAKVVLQEVTNATSCVPMPCTNSYGTLNCDAKDVAGCSKAKVKMQQTVADARIVDVSTDDSGFHPLFKLTGSNSFSFNFNGVDLVNGPCIEGQRPFPSAQAGVDALKNAVKETNISFVPVYSPGFPIERLRYTRVLAAGQCVGDVLSPDGYQTSPYDVKKILARYAEKAPVIEYSENAHIVV